MPMAEDTFLLTVAIELMYCLWHGLLMEIYSPLAALMPAYKYGMLLLESGSSPIVVITMPSLPWHGLLTRVASPPPAMMVQYRCGMPLLERPLSLSAASLSRADFRCPGIRWRGRRTASVLPPGVMAMYAYGMWRWRLAAVTSSLMAI